ncbi:AfsR/SARP family transcriptional regulator, partial [Amycolatopsis lurida]
MGDADRDFRIDLLGEVRVSLAGREAMVGPPRQRAVLAILALRVNQTVSRAELIDGVWGESTPASVEGSVHTYIHGLRRVLSPLGGDVLIRSGGGYRLVVNSDAVDVMVVESRVRRARELVSAGDKAAAAALLGECLG